MRQFRYTSSQILVHWLSAFAVIFLLVTGTFVLAGMPSTPDKISNLRIHMLVGGLVGMMVLVRFWLRSRHPLPPSLVGSQFARIVQTAINLGLLLLVISGSALTLQSGALIAVLGAGQLPADFMVFLPRQVHGILTRVVMGLIALHIVAALYHQFILRDRLMARMGVGRSL